RDTACLPLGVPVEDVDVCEMLTLGRRGQQLDRGAMSEVRDASLGTLPTLERLDRLDARIEPLHAFLHTPLHRVGRRPERHPTAHALRVLLHGHPAPRAR